MTNDIYLHLLVVLVYFLEYNLINTIQGIVHPKTGAREQGVLRVLQHPLFFSVGNCKLLWIKKKYGLNLL